MLQTSQAHNHGKYDNNGLGWIFRFDDDNNMSYNPYMEMDQLNAYNHIYSNNNER